MWLLEVEGDALQGKKLWLRPGKKFLFGRTKAEEGQFVISNKTISRQHLMVEVGVAGPADCADIRTRSILTLTDCNTKIGTLVNGEQIRGKSFVLQSSQNAVSIGRYEHHFTFSWVPVNFTFSFTAKEQKADPYTALYAILGPLDIKVLIDYKRGLTTHLVAKKRNTSKGLQALIDGKYIVHNDSYINAIVVAATPPEDGSKSQALLEEDWVQNFPDPLNYLPPRGEEPTQRDATAYSPNPHRQDMFEGYTFVFCEKRQFENLLAPITDGRGKALLRDVIPHETTVNDFVRYVKGVAGEKGLGEFEDGSAGKGVVVVRFNPVKGTGSEWYVDFNREVSLHLDHRLIEQNEFLDAILGVDASVLRRPLEFVQSSIAAQPSTTATDLSIQTPQISEPAPSATPAAMTPPEPQRRVRSRRTVASRFKGFDDDFNTPVNLNSVHESMAWDPKTAVESQSQDLFVSQDPPIDVFDQQSEPAETQIGRRKRLTPPIEYEEETDIMEQMAPAAAALKKRRLAHEAARRPRGDSTLPESANKEVVPKAKVKPKAIKKEIDVLEVARHQREKAEALAKAEREALQEAMDGMDIEAIRNLAIIEEMEVMRSEPPPRPAAQADESDRWDDKWNGRKNFKKFRRRGADGPGARDFRRVIVPLEEVKKKDFGIGDDYWLDGDSQRKKKKGKGKETQDLTLSQSQGKPASRAAIRAAEILANEAHEEFDQSEEPNIANASDVEIIEPHQPAPKPSTSTRSQRSQKLGDKMNESQNLPAPNRNKRAAATTLTKAGPAKKSRPTVVVAEESEDSDDGLKFKFRTRK